RYQRSGHLFFSKINLVANINPFRIYRSSSITQPLKVLSALRNGPLLKNELFSLIWGNQKYSPRIHDALIHQILHRIRTDLEIPIKISNSQVILEHTLVLDI